MVQSGGGEQQLFVLETGQAPKDAVGTEEWRNHRSYILSHFTG